MCNCVCVCVCVISFIACMLITSCYRCCYIQYAINYTLVLITENK